MNSEFETYPLNEEGLEKIKAIRSQFDHFLDWLKKVVPQGKQEALMKTKLEEACFYAVKGVSQYVPNHLQTGPFFKAEEDL